MLSAMKFMTFQYVSIQYVNLYSMPHSVSLISFETCISMFPGNFLETVDCFRVVFPSQTFSIFTIPEH